MFVNFSYVFGSHLISMNIPLLKAKKRILHLCLKSRQELRPLSLGLSSLPLLKIKPNNPPFFL
jgi:hypothetical protein